MLLTAVMAAVGNILTEITLRFYEATPYIIVLLSNFIGGAFLIGFVTWQRSPIRHGWQKFDWLRVVGAALAIYVFAFMVRFTAVGLIGAGKSALLGRLETIFIVIMAVIFLGEAWSTRHWIAGALALGGTILINLNTSAKAGTMQFQLGWGEFLAIVAPLGIAAGIIILKPVLDRLNAQWITGLTFLLAGLFLLPFLPGYTGSTQLSWPVVGIIALAAILRGTSWSIYNMSMRHIGASRCAIIFLSSTFFTVLAQVVVDAIWPKLRLQVPGNLIMAVIGGIVITIGILILQRASGPGETVIIDVEE